MSICSIEDVRGAVQKPFWFQVYLMRDRSFNLELLERLEALSASSTPADTLAAMDAVATARERIDGNVAPALALEAMLTTILRGTAARQGNDL